MAQGLANVENRRVQTTTGARAGAAAGMRPLSSSSGEEAPSPKRTSALDERLQGRAAAVLGLDLRARKGLSSYHGAARRLVAERERERADWVKSVVQRDPWLELPVASCQNDARRRDALSAPSSAPD